MTHRFDVSDLGNSIPAMKSLQDECRFFVILVEKIHRAIRISEFVKLCAELMRMDMEIC